MRSEISIGNDRVRIDLSERLSPEDRVAFGAILEVASTCGATHLVLDLSELEGAGPADLESLATVQSAAMASGNVLTIVLPQR